MTIRRALMAEGITVRVLGDYGPFSRMGKSIGYLVTLGNAQYLLDCGTPLFQKIGGHGRKYIKGLIITHCHDDHKRWVNEELKRVSGTALERSLCDISADRKLLNAGGRLRDKCMEPRIFVKQAGCSYLEW